MKKTCIKNTILTVSFLLCTWTAAHSMVIDAYFGMNYVFGSGGVPEVQLLDITYVGGGGGVFTTSMPVFAGTTPGGNPGTGLPDGTGSAATPTYTTTFGGDGETTATIGATVPIDWDMTSFAFPTIAITDITVDAPAVGGIWTAEFTTPYVVGLIPAGLDSELSSALSSPQGDIYDSLAGAPGNTVASGKSTSAPIGYGIYVGSAFGDFIFSASSPSPVPVPGALWLFGAGLIGLFGMAKKT